MNAQAAREAAQKATQRIADEKRAAREEEERELAEAAQRGRLATGLLTEVRERIRAAADQAKSSVEANIAGRVEESARLRAYYSAAQEMIKSVLESEGYVVAVDQSIREDKPVGSDPLYDRTMYWLNAIVKVSW